jgi:hypothetical protein
MRSSGHIAETTFIGVFFGGLAFASVVFGILLSGIWMTTGRNSNFESALAGRVAVVSVLVAAMTETIFILWGRYLKKILSTGDRIAAEVLSVRGGRNFDVVVRIPGQGERTFHIFGECVLEQGQFVTLRVPPGKSWPILIENHFPAS